MNEPRPMPNLPAAMPTCPRCQTNDRVTALDPPTLRRNAPMTEDAPSWPFECATCVLVFTGTEEEFLRMTNVRHAYRKAQQRRNVPEGVR